MIERAALALALLVVACAAPAEVVVTVENRSAPTQCAEEDNVDLRLVSPIVGSFRIEARHPAYLESLTRDNTAPDFSNCGPAPAPEGARTFTPQRQVLGAGGDWRVIGITYPSFWREPVPVVVAGRAFDDVHLIQIWTRGRPSGDEEVLVLYPPDGYWRARPLAPDGAGRGTPDAPATAYGSSFLIGPVEDGERPYVDIERVEIDPDTAGVTLSLRRGGEATVRIAALDRARIVVDADLTQTARALPFAALRSMFVGPDNADAAEVTWRTPEGGVERSSVLEFAGARTVALTTERTTPGRHNSSAPDVTFGRFATTSR
ncbi:MAG: hypothetical protein ACM30I_12235 [Gemmatimonas sp.]